MLTQFFSTMGLFLAKLWMTQRLKMPGTHSHPRSVLTRAVTVVYLAIALQLESSGSTMKSWVTCSCHSIPLCLLFMYVVFAHQPSEYLKTESLWNRFWLPNQATKHRGYESATSNLAASRIKAITGWQGATASKCSTAKLGAACEEGRSLFSKAISTAWTQHSLQCGDKNSIFRLRSSHASLYRLVLYPAGPTADAPY